MMCVPCVTCDSGGLSKEALLQPPPKQGPNKACPLSKIGPAAGLFWPQMPGVD
jgi:hypothetical protein